MKIDKDLQERLDELVAYFKIRGYILQTKIMKQPEEDFWDLFYNRQKLKVKMKNEDQTPYEPFDYPSQK